MQVFGTRQLRLIVQCAGGFGIALAVFQRLLWLAGGTECLAQLGGSGGADVRVLVQADAVRAAQHQRQTFAFAAKFDIARTPQEIAAFSSVLVKNSAPDW